MFRWSLLFGSASTVVLIARVEFGYFLKVREVKKVSFLHTAVCSSVSPVLPFTDPRLLQAACRASSTMMGFSLRYCERLTTNHSAIM